MGMSTDIRLPRASNASFPPECIACRAPTFEEHLRFSGRTWSWAGLVLPTLGNRFVVEVPCCEDCARRLRRQRRLRAATFLTATVVLMFVVLPFYADLAPSIRRTVGIATLLLLLAPYFVFEVYFPPPFDLSVQRDVVDYEFADVDYAETFCALNADEGAEEV